MAKRKQRRTAKCYDGHTLTQLRLDRDRRATVHVTAGGLRVEASPLDAKMAAAVVARKKAAPPAGRLQFRVNAAQMATMMLPGSAVAITAALKQAAEVVLKDYLEAKVRTQPMKTKILMTLAVLAMPAMAAAQTTPPITHLQVTMYRTGSSTPAVAPFEIAITSMECNQPVTPPPTGVVVNPTMIVVEDPVNGPTRECRWRETGTGVIAMLGFDPAATYFGRAAWRNPNGLSVNRTDSNSFSRPGTVPSVPPAFVRVVPGQ